MLLDSSNYTLQLKWNSVLFPRVIMMHFISVCFASAEDGDIWCFDKSNHGHLGNDGI